MDKEGLKRILKYAILHNAMSRSVEEVFNEFEEDCVNLSYQEVEILNNEDDLPF